MYTGSPDDSFAVGCLLDLALALPEIRPLVAPPQVLPCTLPRLHLFAPMAEPSDVELIGLQDNSANEISVGTITELELTGEMAPTWNEYCVKCKKIVSLEDPAKIRNSDGWRRNVCSGPFRDSSID